MFALNISHEYQMIMAVIWKRINDTGKNWRHVYKVCNFYDFFIFYLFFKLTCGCYVFGFLSNFHVISTLSVFSIFTKWLWYWNLKKIISGESLLHVHSSISGWTLDFDLYLVLYLFSICCFSFPHYIVML